MENKAVAVGREHKRHVHHLGVFESLLHARADSVIVVLRLDDGKGEVRFVVEQVVGLFGFAAPDSLPPDNHAPSCEKCLLPDLGHQIPVAADDGGGDELRPNIRLGELLLIQISRGPDCHKGRSMRHSTRFREAKRES